VYLLKVQRSRQCTSLSAAQVHDEGRTRGAWDLSSSIPPAAARHARRLYVGGISDATETELRAFFNETIARALDTEDLDHVASVYINRQRFFAFLELRTAALATACLQLDGITFQGQTLKIRRPNDYRPPPGDRRGASSSQDHTPVLDLSALGMLGSLGETVPQNGVRMNT
jgi:splicing factor U2AF 65 kDa subunit